MRTDVPRRVVTLANMLIGWLGGELDKPRLLQNSVEYVEANPESIFGDPMMEIQQGRALTYLGRVDDGVKLVAGRHRQIAAAGYPAHTATTALFLAEVLISRGHTEDVVQAGELLDEAEATAKNHRLFGLSARILNIRNRIAAVTGKTSRRDGLTKREVEILSFIAGGQSNPQIADNLVISRHTVVRHIANIFEKIDVHNRAQATAYALEHGITRPNEE